MRIGEISWESIAEKLATLPFVEKVQAVSGDIDIMLTVSAPDHEQLSQAILRDIHDMPGVVSTRSHLILEEIGGSPARADAGHLAHLSPSSSGRMARIHRRWSRSFTVLAEPVGAHGRRLAHDGHMSLNVEHPQQSAPSPSAKPFRLLDNAGHA